RRDHLSPRRSRSRQELSDRRLGQWRLLPRRPLERSGDGGDRLARVLRRRRRNPRIKRARSPLGWRWGRPPRLRRLGHRRERQALQRVLPEHRHDEGRGHGFSCGGLMAAGTAADPRMTTWGHTSSGSFSVNQAFYDSIHTPVLIVTGTEDSLGADENGARDFENISKLGDIPVMMFAKIGA